MTAANTPPLHVLRRIIRHLRTAPKPDLPKSRIPKTTPEQNTSENPLIKQVLSQYRAAKDLPPAQASMMRKMAYDLSALKGELRERGRLHKLDGGAESKLSPKEMSRLAARRAGLELPDV